jgi:hypothetical protein
MNITSSPTAIAPVESDNSIVASEYKPDWKEFLRFLQILGKDINTTRMRALDPIKGGGGIKYDASEENFLKYSRMGKNQYIMPNNGGDTDAEITECIATFIEFDNLSIEEQLKAYITFNLLEPTVMVFTADKSVHIYWVYSTPITDIKAWRELQSDLIALTGADKSIKNPSRVMAAVGGVKIQKQTGITKGVAAIVHESGKRYSFEEIRASVPKAPIKGKPAKVKDKPVKLVPPVVTEPSQSGLMTYDDAIARIEQLTGDPSAYNRYAHNFTQDSSDPSKWRGDCAWHDSQSGTAFYFNQSPDGKFRWHCPECDVGGTLIEYHAKMDSGVSAEPPTGRAFLDFIESKFDGIRIDRSSVRSQSPQSSKSTSGGIQNNVVAFPGKTPDDDDIQQLKAELEALLAKTTKKSEISRFKATRSLSPSLARLVDDWVEEFIQSTQLEEEKQDLLKVIGSTSSISLVDYLPESLAVPLAEWAADIQVPQSCIMTVILPLIGHHIGHSSIRLKSKWHEPPILFTCIAGKSGSGKSPIFNAIAMQPLYRLQEEYDLEFLQMKEEYDAWKRLPREEKESIPEPPEPFRKPAFVQNFTPEALHTLADKFPQDGAFIVSDELSEVFSNQGKYSGGRGSDKEELLKYYGGYAPNVARKTSFTGAVKFHLNIAGATQLSTLQELVARRDASSGEWARFDFCILPTKKKYHSLYDSESPDLTPILVDLCKHLQRQPKQEYRLTTEAFQLHKRYCNILEDMAFTEVNESYRLAIMKAQGKVGRIALILHCAAAACDRVQPDAEIDDTTMARAIELIDFYLNQADRIYRLQSTVTLTPDLEAILDLARRKGSITPRDVCQAFGGKRRKTSEQARALMVSLSEMGIGRVEASGKSIKYIPPKEEGESVGNVGNVGNLLADLPTQKKPYIEPISEDKNSNVGNVGNFSLSSENKEVPPDIEDKSPSFGGTPQSENISTPIPPTLPTNEIQDAEKQSESSFECVGSPANILPTLPTLPTQEVEDPNQPLTLEDIEASRQYIYVDGRRCVCTANDWASNPPKIDLKFEDGSTKTILDPAKLKLA